ncbi:glycoside hydrolase family 3 protein [Amycolatopsis tucumanensis]|uniref:beta-N-acetylhexosaminidase n=1 Tax=Amycolatopsis tucumanensis TaxID=401106 RepID=A0ABP7IWG8_9PSEU|nr:glycoside hydrolase family 3 protein [Amycolatopsis tucumanensis]MCF6427339.1 glycoside hydrolase family 3 protein [Amycolatopsis tucumanensis]
MLAAIVVGVLGVSAVGASSAATGRQDGWAEQTLRKMSLEEKVGQLFVADVWGKSAGQADEGNRKKYGVDTAAEVVQRYHPGGVIYFNNSGTDNVDDPAQVARFSNGLQQAALSSGAKVPLIVSTDQEGGRVTRIAAPATEFPSSMAIGAGRSAADARTLATVNGHELRAMGINQDFAPDADVNSNPLNPVIGSRSFSADPALAGELVAAEVDGYQNSGPATETVSAAAKHFPGHGDAATDSHTGLPVINRTEEQWRQIDLPPFRAAIDAGADVIMSAHITVPSLDPSGEPATLSKPIMTGILRDELRYDGVVATDSLQMAGVRELHTDAEIPVLALEAGVDQMLMPPDLGLAINSVLDAVKSGRLTEERIDQSVLRILKLKDKRGIVASPLVNPRAVKQVVGSPANREKIQAITDRTTTVLRNDAGLLPRREPGKVLVTGWNNPNYPGYPAEPVRALAERLGGTAVSTGAKPTAAKIAEAVAAAGEADTVVVLTNGLRTDTAQGDLVRELLATGKPVVAVSVQEPYDPGYADVPTWVATYDWRDVTMASLAKVLTGEISPQGKLPVDIPAGDDAGQIRYPFGTGLTW